MIAFQSKFWTVETLEAFLEAIEKRFLTGPIIRVKTGPAQETEFDTRKVDLESIQMAILSKLNELAPDDYDDPNSKKIMRVTVIHSY